MVIRNWWTTDKTGGLIPPSPPNCAGSTVSATNMIRRRTTTKPSHRRTGFSYDLRDQLWNSNQGLLETMTSPAIELHFRVMLTFTQLQRTCLRNVFQAEVKAKRYFFKWARRVYSVDDRASFLVLYLEFRHSL